MAVTAPDINPILFNRSALGQTRDTIVVVGGGMAALFTAYEIMKQAREDRKKTHVTVIADRLSAPSVAGSHVVLELEGLFSNNVPNRNIIHDLLREGLQSLEATIERENIQSRYNKGYEIKAKTRGALDNIIDTLVEKRIYDAHEISRNSGEQRFYLPGHRHSASVDSIGQINVPDMLNGLLGRLVRMGATVKLGTKYMGHETRAEGDHMIYTSDGMLHSTHKPFLATGAKHQSLLPNFNAAAKVIYTMGLVMGPLSPFDSKIVAHGPMAFCDDEIDGDVLWGGLDEQNYLTMGYGDLESPGDKEALFKEISGMIASMYPGLMEKYPPKVCFGPVIISENGLPSVGRTPEYDVAGGWGNSGIVAGYAAAHAYARWIVRGRDDELKVFEGMQPDRFGAPANNNLRTLQNRGLDL